MGIGVFIMAGKETKLSVWALDPEISLEQIPSLLQLDYVRNIEYLEEVTVQNPLEKKLMNRWREYNDGMGFEIRETEILGNSLNYIPATAYLEFAVPKDQAMYDQFLVPRTQRVNHTMLPVFFYEFAGRVYVIVTGPEYKVRNIRSFLMGGGKKPNESHTRWKKVQFKDIPNYSFSSDFFYWLISKENSSIKTEEFDLNISDIRYLAQSPDRRDVRHESEGDNLLDEAMSKTGLGVNSRVGQVGTTISTSAGTLRFSIFETGDCYVDNYDSGIIDSKGEISPFESTLDKGALMLYAVILPELKAAFNTEKISGVWTTQQQADSRKNWALGAINELCSENEVSMDDISQLDWFK
jgi:hypothetical protein